MHGALVKQRIQVVEQKRDTRALQRRQPRVLNGAQRTISLDDELGRLRSYTQCETAHGNYEIEGLQSTETVFSPPGGIGRGWKTLISPVGSGESVGEFRFLNSPKLEFSFEIPNVPNEVRLKTLISPVGDLLGDPDTSTPPPIVILSLLRTLPKCLP